jgi:hypothetical protein
LKSQLQEVRENQVLELSGAGAQAWVAPGRNSLKGGSSYCPPVPGLSAGAQANWPDSFLSRFFENFFFGEYLTWILFYFIR